MNKYNQEACQNMLDCQLATNGVSNSEIIAAFGAVPRDLFLPVDKKLVAYGDDDILLGKEGGFMMAPVPHARMVQAAQPTKNMSVLNIGDTTGYASAILSYLVSTVIVLEAKPKTLHQARDVWDRLGCCNIAVVSGKNTEGCADHAPYDLIFINGAVVDVPDMLLEQLDVTGRLLTVIKKPGAAMGVLSCLNKTEEGRYETQNLLDVATPYAKDFNPEVCFVF